MNNELNFNREEWLTQAANCIRAMVIEPALERTHINLSRVVKIAVSIGHPKSKRALGECWSTEVSEDKRTNQIFITPFNNDSLKILDVLTHELIHAFDNCENGHRNRFATLARACDLQGKLTATYAGQELKATLLNIVDALGAIPHTKLDRDIIEQPKQKARMLKIECEECGLIVRASRTAVERIYNNDNARCPCCNAVAYDLYAMESLIK